MEQCCVVLNIFIINFSLNPIKSKVLKSINILQNMAFKKGNIHVCLITLYFIKVHGCTGHIPSLVLVHS